MKLRTTLIAIMGCGSSKPTADPVVKEAVVRSDKIERQLRQDRKKESRTVKILLLGMECFR